MQAEAVLNVVQAFMVARVPCMMMPHWLSNNAWVTSLLFDWLYQHMKEGEDVATALHHAMLEMLDDGFGIKYHYNKKGAYCDPNIIANNKEISFRKPAVLNNNSSQTLKPLRNPHLRTRTIASSSQLPKLNQSQNISDYNVFYT
jgi:hypothetical protein